MLKASDLTGEAYHHTVGDVETLHKLVDMLSFVPIIVNIGVCFGTSVIAMLEHRPDAYVVGIDVNACPDAIHNLILAELYDQGRFLSVMGRSQDVAMKWPWDVDMVFVDGGHGYQDCLQDIVRWYYHVKPGGIIAVHDYGTPSLPTVVKATDDAEKELRLHEFLHVERIKAFYI